MEAQLLHIESADHMRWRFAGCIALSPAHVDSTVKNIYEATYLPGVLQVLSETLSVGGPCYGWYVVTVLFNCLSLSESSVLEIRVC